MCRAALQISIATLLVCRAALQISIATLLICRAALRISIATLLICRAALRIAMAILYSAVLNGWTVHGNCLLKRIYNERNSFWRAQVPVSISMTDWPTGRWTILLRTNKMGGWSDARSDSPSCLLKQAPGYQDRHSSIHLHSFNHSSIHWMNEIVCFTTCHYLFCVATTNVFWMEILTYDRLSRI